MPRRLRSKTGRRPSSKIAALAHALRIEPLEPREMLTAEFSVANVVAAEGTTVLVPIVWSGWGTACTLQYATGPDSGGIPPGNPYSNFVPAQMGWTTEPPSGEIDVPVQTLEDAGSPYDTASHLVAFDSSIYSYDGGNGQENIQATVDIVEPPAAPRNCTCSCSCGNLEAGVTRQAGGPTANSGQGTQPQDLYYYGLADPHPIVSVNDTLSSTVAQASDIRVQTTLDDLSGNVLYTAPAEYYSPAGYTPGQQVQFSTQLNAAGLADGTYQYTTIVTEQYPNSSPVIRAYTNPVGIRNLDNSPYGSGWMLHNVDRLIIQSHSASIEDGSGNVDWYDLDGNGHYTVPVGRPDVQSLVKNSDGTFTLTCRDQSQEVFAANGLLATAVDKNGNKTTYQWNADSTLASVTNQSGQQTTFSYTNGQLTSVTDFAGRVTTYGYTGGKLTSITLPAPGDGEQQHVTTMTYDGTTGLLGTITDAGGTTTLNYNDLRQVTSITDPDQSTTHYTASDNASLIDPASGLGTVNNPAPLVYTANVDGSTTDGNNHTSSYTVDAYSGQTLSTTDATGQNTTTYQYNNAGQVTQITQPPITSGGQNLVTVLKYDGNGNLIERDLPDGSKETWTFDTTWNEPTSYIDAAGRQTDYSLDATNGNVLTVTQVGQNGDPNLVTTYTYTPNPTAQGQTPGGLVATMTDPRGIVTKYSYNSAGLVTSIIYAYGTSDQASVSFTYDANDNLASYTNELSQTTNYTFDNSNRKVGQQDPPPDPNNPNVRPTWAWSFDPRGNLLSQQDPLDRVTSYAYSPGSDGDNPELTQMTQPDPNGGTNYTVTTYGHDGASNLTSITDPLSRLESMGFDADNRLTSVTMPNPVGGGSGGPSESVVYNALGMPVQQFDLMGHETDNTFNWRGQVLTTTGPAPTQGAQRPTEKFTYNNDGQVLTDQNPLGATTQYVYDSFGRLTEEILPDPDGSGPLTSPTLHWTYDADSNVATFQDSNGNTYSYTYNNRNELVQENDPSPDGGHTPGPVWQWQYNAAGELVETIDPMNRVTQYVLDGDGNRIQTIAPNLTTGGPGDASTTTTDTFDLDNERTSETTPNGATTSWQFNDLGQITQETQPVPMTGGTAPVWQYQVNKDNELTQETNPLNLTQTTTFDGMGRPTNQTAFDGVQTAWTYDNNSDILTTTTGTGTLAQTVTNTWDALGRETATQNASGTTSMAFDLAGRMTSLTDPDQNQTVWTRDNLGRVTAEQNPSGSETFSYDANSNLTQQVDFNGQTRDFTFDDLNRETAETWMSGGTAINTIGTSYNAAGQVVSTGDNYSDYAFGYDGQGNATSVDNSGTPGAPHVVLTSQYNAQGERTSLAATISGTADFINSYGYDNLSRLNQITQQEQSGGNAVQAKSIYVGYDNAGDISEIDYSNTTSPGPQQNGPGYAVLSYSTTTGQLTGINDENNGVSLDNLTFTYDGLGRVSTFASIDGTATYGYDHTSQLVSATYTTASGGHQPANVSFTWDANGNNNAPGNVVSPNNEVTNDGTFTYTFDANGNRTSRTQISNNYASDYKTTYTWDYRNRLTDVETYDNNSVLTKHVHYTYDVYNNLIEEQIDPNGGGSYTTTEQFALDVQPKLPVQVLSLSGTIDPSAPPDTLLEFVNGALAERFLSAPSPSGVDAVFAQGQVNSLTQADVVDWNFVNNQGSPTDVVNSSGTLIDHQVFSPFGQVVYVSNSGVFVFQGFSGGMFDPNTGLIKFGERWYDPATATWIRVDPAGFRAGDPDLSRYIGNRPTAGSDPSGMFPELAQPPVAGGPWWRGLPDLTPDEELLLFLAFGDLDTELSLLELFAVVHQYKVSWAASVAHGNCHAWANGVYAQLVNDRATGMFTLFVQMHTYKYIGLSPIWWDHSFLEVVLPNGFVFYVDNTYLGGPDHIFFPGDIPSILVTPESREYQEWLDIRERCASSGTGLYGY